MKGYQEEWKKKAENILMSYYSKEVFLSEWEKAFVRRMIEITGSGKELSFHQSKTLRQIHDRIK